MNNNNVEIIKPTLKTICIKQNREIKLIRACAYCRVSTDSRDQQNSFENQNLYFNRELSKNPDYKSIF